jgi:hypothetical protein
MLAQDGGKVGIITNEIALKKNERLIQYKLICRIYYTRDKMVC